MCNHRFNQKESRVIPKRFRLVLVFLVTNKTDSYYPSKFEYTEHHIIVLESVGKRPVLQTLLNPQQAVHITSPLLAPILSV